MRLRYILARVLLAFMCVESAYADPDFGILQFKVEHNLETEDCLASGTCFIDFEEVGDPSSWLFEIRARSNLAVLHWDRGIPWLIFDADAPSGVSRVSHYDALLDSSTLVWLDALSAHFAAMNRGYLAVSILSGSRDGLAPLYLGPTNQLPVLGVCPVFSPGTQVIVDPGTGPVLFDLERSYRNFILYLAEKLTPEFIALMVEVNVIEEKCPARAEGLYALYRSIHDQVEAELGSQASLFATLAYLPLLEYDRQSCYPTSAFIPCGSGILEAAPDAGVDACYPVDTNAIDALNLGGRLDVLALSFYPDALEMNVVANETSETQAFTLDDWNAGLSCFARLDYPVPVDPMAALDRLGWSGPVAIAETSARSCVSPMRFDLVLGGGPTPTPTVFEVAGSPASQAAWVAETYHASVDRNFVFYIHSFLRDYAPVGPWLVEAGVSSAETQRLINTWPCSGLQDSSGTLKPGIEAIGLPEPSMALGGIVGSAALGGLARRRTRLRSDVSHSGRAIC